MAGFPDDYSCGTWKLTPMQGTPVLAQGVIDGMHRVMQTPGSMLVDDPACFYDYAGKPVSVPSGRNGQPRVPIGYCEALWDLENHNLTSDASGERLYRRDTDPTGRNRRLTSWHAVENLATEYDVRSIKSSQAWDRQLLLETRKLGQRMIRGVTFGNRAYFRGADGRTAMTEDRQSLALPYLIACPTAYDHDIASMAIRLAKDLTVDEHSAENLMRMFATPALQPYQHLLYIMYGGGGNGKGILLGSLEKSFPRLAHTIDAGRITGGRHGDGGFSQENEMSSLMGALWAYDSEADSIGLEQLTTLKRIATGDAVTARQIGHNETKFKPQATMVIATNNPVVTTMTAASARRYVYVRMRDGRKAQDFQPLLDFIHVYGAAGFLMASCDLWLHHGDEPWHDVTIGSPDDLTEAQQWIVDEINDHGYAINRNNPYRQYTSELHETCEQLGLMTVRKRIEGVLTRVLVVSDKRRFDVYRTDDKPAAHEPVPDIPQPLDGQVPTLPSEMGFACDYTPARPDKSAIGWQRMARDPKTDTSKPPQDARAWTVVPKPGYMVIDMDVAEDGATGWKTLNQEAGRYGTPDFPSTWLVRTPHGGVHAYYKVPERLEGHLKDAVHNGGVPVDIRADRKGYVIGAGSNVTAGRYDLCDLPKGDSVPELSDKLADWLIDHGYTDLKQEQAPQAPTSFQPQDMTPPTRLMGTGTPDMTPIPKGQRNSQLHAWAYGRLVHYPQDRERIRQDLYTRARLSGLPDQETDGIWRSLMRRLGNE